MDFIKLPKEEEKLLKIIIESEASHISVEWQQKFDNDEFERIHFEKLIKMEMIRVQWADNIPFFINVLRDGQLYKKNKRKNFGKGILSFFSNILKIFK